MKVTVVRGGGLAGIVTETEVDSDQLSPDDADALERRRPFEHRGWRAKPHGDPEGGHAARHGSLIYFLAWGRPRPSQTDFPAGANGELSLRNPPLPPILVRHVGLRG